MRGPAAGRAMMNGIDIKYFGTLFSLDEGKFIMRHFTMTPPIMKMIETSDRTCQSSVCGGVAIHFHRKVIMCTL